VLLGLSCSAALASNGFKSDCDEVSEALPAVKIPTPSLTVRVVDHGLTNSAADMKDPASDPAAEKINSPALAEVADVKLNDNGEATATDDDDALPVNNLPETALVLPGVSEQQLPRFRRQMYRTDI
jgi:hypothetical protein